MRRKTRQLSIKECYAILMLEKGADLEALKRAYRRRAFELHPDLNPDNPEASRQFQLLNEAYVALSGVLKPAAENREKKQARRPEAQARQNTADRAGAQPQNQKKQEPERGQEASGPQTGAGRAEESRTAEHAQSAAHEAKEANGQAGSAEGSSRREQAEESRNGYAEQDVLRDLLNDPFARRVFEDIYSELNRKQADVQDEAKKNTSRPRPTVAREKKNTKLHQSNLAWGTSKWNTDFNKGVTGIVKDWLRRQIDEEQSLTLPAANLAPGRHVRLQIRRGISGELHTVEITLPPDFSVGKPVRLRGLGKRVGPWQGDLYLTLYNE